MDLLLLAAILLTAGFSLGYGVREAISRKRRARAKRTRKFFSERPLYVENLSAKSEIANPFDETVTLVPNLHGESRHSIMSFQRGTTVELPSAPAMF